MIDTLSLVNWNTWLAIIHNSWTHAEIHHRRNLWIDKFLKFQLLCMLQLLYSFIRVCYICCMLLHVWRVQYSSWNARTLSIQKFSSKLDSGYIHELLILLYLQGILINVFAVFFLCSLKVLASLLSGMENISARVLFPTFPTYHKVCSAPVLCVVNWV